MSEAEDPRIGKVIDGRYLIDRKIADGGMATVYLATDSRLERKVAVKIMHTQLAQGPRREQFVQRFHREARSAAAVANPHIVQVYDTGEYDGLDYLVMEYVHGINLRRAILSNGTFTIRDTVRVISETLDGLSAAHLAGLVHRDIKPENILINDRGHVQITDFGLAKAASEATLSSTGLLLGTAAYLAPEMIEDNTSTPQGDLYSVGVMAYEMIAGQVPFQSDNPVTMVFKHVHESVPPLSALDAGVPEPISRFVLHLTARHMQDRPANATAALVELEALARSLTPAQLAFRIPPQPGAGEPDPSQPPRPIVTTPLIDEDGARTVPDTDGDADGNGTGHGADGGTSIGRTRVLPTASHEDFGPQGGGDTSSEGTVSPTKPLDTADGPRNGTAGKGTKARRPYVLPIAIALIVALVASGCAFGAWWWFRGPASYWVVPQAEDVTCSQYPCPVAGADWSRYEQLLKVSGIAYAVSEEYSDDVARNHVVSIDPDAGAHLSKRAGDTLKVVVSKGKRQATVPTNILDCTATPDPLAALKDAGFTNLPSTDSLTKEYSTDVAAGCALAIKPDPGKTTDHDATITLTVSQGPQPVQMPDVVGKTKDDAMAELLKLQLTIKYVLEHNDSVDSGKVVSADKQPGTRLHSGDTVNLVISSGPQTATVPSGLVGKDEDDVTKQLEDLGFKVKTERVLGGVFGTVRDILNGDTSISGGADVRVRDKNGKPTVLTIKVV